MPKPVEIEILLKDGISQPLDKIQERTAQLASKANLTEQELQEVADMAQAAAAAVSLLEDQLEQMRLAAETAAPDLDQSANIAQIEALEDKVEQLTSTMEQLNDVAAQTQVAPPDQDQAEQGFDTLQASIQQVGRELPALAYGPKVFFSAISNNLPAVADAIKKARMEYAAARAAGQQATPVWMRLLSSVFSWQTALTVGITLLTMYGDKIIDLVAGLFKAREATDKITDKMKISTQEMLELEKGAAAERLKAKFELEQYTKRIQDFNGTKEQEKVLLGELNDKYGEQFGHMATLAQWYDTLTQKGGDYIQMLFLRQKAEAMVTKATEADEEVNKIKAQTPEEVDGGWSKTRRGMMTWTSALALDRARVAAPVARISQDVESAAARHNQENYDRLLSEAEAKVQRYLDEARALQAQADELARNNNLGGHDKPAEAAASAAKDEHEARMREERRRAEELMQLRLDNEQEQISQMKDGSEKRIRQIALDYERELAAIATQEDKWAEAQGGQLTPEQNTATAEARRLATEKMRQERRQVEREEVEAARKRYDELMQEYQTYDQRRRQIAENYADDMALMQEHLDELRRDGADTTQVEQAMRARQEAMRREMQQLQQEVLQSTDFYNRLFSDLSQRGYKLVKDFYAQARRAMDEAKSDATGVVLTLHERDENGEMVARRVRVSVEEYERMQKRVDEIRDHLQKKNPFSAMGSAWKELVDALKNGGDVGGALAKLQGAADEAFATVRKWGDSLGEIFGDQLGKALQETIDTMQGCVDMGIGLGQAMSGDVVGGITGILGGLAKIVGSMNAWKEKQEEMKRIEFETRMEFERNQRRRTEEMAQRRDLVSQMIQDQKLLNMLQEEGFVRGVTVSAWRAQSEGYDQLMASLTQATERYADVRERLYASDAEWTEGRSLEWTTIRRPVEGLTDEMIELCYNQNKLTKDARLYYEQWKETGEEIDDLIGRLEEAKTQMRDMVMGQNFESFLQRVSDTLQQAQGRVSDFADFTQQTIREALMKSFMYKHLADMVEPLYNELADAISTGAPTDDFIATWADRMNSTMAQATEGLQQAAQAMGIDPWADATHTQSAQAGAFMAMTQDQGTKLEGLFVSGQIHWANIDSQIEDVAAQMTAATEHLRRIDDHTGQCSTSLRDIRTDIQRMLRDGLKVK